MLCGKRVKDVTFAGIRRADPGFAKGRGEKSQPAVLLHVFAVESGQRDREGKASIGEGAAMQVAPGEVTGCARQIPEKDVHGSCECQWHSSKLYLQCVQGSRKRNMGRLKAESDCLMERKSWCRWGHGARLREDGSREVIVTAKECSDWAGWGENPWWD